MKQLSGSDSTSELLDRLEQLADRSVAETKRELAQLESLPLPELEDLIDRCTGRLGAGDDLDSAHRRTAWEVLDLVRRSTVLRRIDRERTAAWAQRILGLVEASHFTVGPLFRQRAGLYGSKTLFELDAAGHRRTWSWRRVASRVEFLSRVLLSLDPADDPGPVALLSENRIEIALLDLACLSSGLVNVMVPANATDSDVGYILRHSKVGTVIVSGQQQLAKVLKNRDSLDDLVRIVTLDPEPGHGADVVSLDALASRAEQVPRELPRERGERVKIGDLATIMYTSGTTGTPKGIQFSHRNIVFKRFARALALPEIGERDVFLCFLPLYHTFGRFLELLGCVFWGATYCFLESTSLEGLSQGMRRFRPTVFISVPKKWMQLHELIAQQADPEEDSDTKIRTATERVTGGRLRWGLSAAGHLDSDVFRFFQRQGVGLLSGFGMTEATGGITMTPPGQYEEGSLGSALPGIELQLAHDGELLVRGPYVMIGYWNPPAGESSFDEHGWFHSGDLMQQLPSGHLRLIDRKKEIYKNIKGETIAPQRVENLFRDFDSVGRAFLVGDRRDYNTLLIYPNPDFTELDLDSLSSQEVLDHFRSLVVSVNQFLAPYERIVDFTVIPRDLDAERGELTPKGTLRRKVVEQNFSDTIRQLYRRTRVHVGDVDVVIPNWLFQILGLTAQDIRFGTEAIMLPASRTRLTLLGRGPGMTQMGSCLYRHPPGSLDLGSLLTTPRLWLGNEELVSFVQLDTVTRQRSIGKRKGIEWVDRPTAYEPADDEHGRLESYLGRPDLDLLDLDLAARMLASSREIDALLAIRVLEEVLNREAGPLVDPARRLLARASRAAAQSVRRRAFQVLVPSEKESRFKDVVRRFLERDEDLLDAETRLAVSDETLSATKVEAFIELTHQACSAEAGESGAPRARGLLRFLAAYGATHPVSYRRIRAFLERMSLVAAQPDLCAQARHAADELLDGFRKWLGPTARIAVDFERGREYRWEDVTVFDDAVPQRDRRRLLSALKSTAFLREAVFLFSSGVSIGLSDIVAHGVRIGLLGSLHGKSVYRIAVQTRFHGSFELVANLNHDLPSEQVQQEIHWLVLSGDPGSDRPPLVEEFGGYWPEQDLWSEEFVTGETLDRAMHRLSDLPDHEERLRRLWPYMAWATLSAFVDFWHRSGRRVEIADPNMTNVIVPTRDFLAGVRIVSLSRRRPHRGLLAMIRAFREEFVDPAQQQYPVLQGLVDWRLIFSALLEVVGEVEGIVLLRQVVEQAEKSSDDELAQALRRYTAEVEEHGFIPMRLFFAAERYHRWAKLSADATPQARARTLRELYETYGLQRLTTTYPEIRVRFFRETVFQNCSPALADGLQRIIRSMRDGELPAEELIDAVDELRADTELGRDDEYFLARLSYPYLRPQDAAGFVRAEFGGKRQSEIVVTLEDRSGSTFRVRHAFNPKEVERLLRLFLAAKLDVRFRMEHHYLVAINERSQIIGGIYYEIEDEGNNAHLEKIVVAERQRGRGIARGLMQELQNRLRAAGVETLTTGFFLPDYFYAYGFRVEKQYAGLVKDLKEVRGQTQV